MQADGLPGFGLPLSGNHDFAEVGELDGVAHKIDDNLAEAAGVPQNGFGGIGLDFVDEFETFLVSAEPQRLHGFAKALAEVKGDGLE
jgi:hypothetical protein